MHEPLPSVPARALTRTLFLFVLLLMIGALAWMAWIAAINVNQIGV